MRGICCHIKIISLHCMVWSMNSLGKTSCMWDKLSPPKIYHHDNIGIYAFCIMIGVLAHKWSASCDINFTQNTRPMQSIQSHEATYTTTPPTFIPDEHHLDRDETLVSLLAWVNTILHCCSMIAVISSCVLRRKRTLHVSNLNFSDTNRQKVSS